MKNTRDYRGYDCRLLLAAVVLLLCGQGVHVVGQDWEVDWDTVNRIGATVAEQVQASPVTEQLKALASSAEVDWELVGRLVEQVLDENSWENAALLRPYAERALARLVTVQGNENAAAWFRQRLDYLQVAEEYVREDNQSAAPPVVTPPSVPSTKPTPARPVPPPVKPVPKTPVKHKVKMDQDTKMWIGRMPADPSADAQRLVPALRKIFDAEGVPSSLVWLAEVESSFNPNARSPVGAAGLYQFMPATAERFGLATAPIDQRLDPERSATAAARYLRLLYNRFSDWPLALAAYNAGEGRVGNLLRQQKAKRFEEIADVLPLETRMYVPRVAAVVHRRDGKTLRLLPAPSKR